VDLVRTPGLVLHWLRLRSAGGLGWLCILSAGRLGWLFCILGAGRLGCFLSRISLLVAGGSPGLSLWTSPGLFLAGKYPSAAGRRDSTVASISR
jgi:hypothetical protein